ncbi:hypothetical protein GCM10027275_17350 [Rhabdobacter roseus]|uniref:Peptidase S9 prolyl oligopeptidase catalytic domain-containing protein n=1 Tax=Rhabdobacter roseus TaxID=1655419 RepID=A0A840TVG5_9BACT|nr:prolyl oligopeptidase family serine peptidase [Rhabdobacter roseus]MBB5283659.1 hypothetical protein [Rhabdobacter roseus]
MPKNFYTYAIFFLALAVLFSLSNGLLFVLLRTDVFVLHSFSSWFLVGHLVTLGGWLVVLKYLHYHRYWLSFAAGIIAALAFLAQFLVSYRLLLMYREWEPYFLPAVFFALSADTLYALSLVFSKPGKHPLLRWSGILWSLLGLILLSTLVVLVNTTDVQLKGYLENLHRYTSWTGSLGLLLWVFHFRREDRQPLQVTAGPRRSEWLEVLLGFSTFLALGFTLYLGMQVALQAYEHTHISGRARQLAQPFEARTYRSPQGETMMYRLLKPLDYDPKKKYPLVVCLPYSCREDNIRQVDACPPAQWLMREENRKKYPAFLFVPRCPPFTGWGGVRNTPSVDALAIEAIRALSQDFSIDEKRRYVTGVSRGGYGSWHFITNHPGLFAAAVPVCGSGDPALAHHAADVSVWAFHGAKDRNVPVGGSRDMIAALKKNGSTPRYTEYPDLEHDIWWKAEQTPGLLDWLFEQKRK